MTNLHIITRCSRSENLNILLNSIFSEQHFFNITWHIGFDIRRSKISILSDILFKKDNIVFSSFFSDANDFGHKWINKVVSKIKNDFIYILDDDNIIHKNFYEEISKSILENPTKKYFIFNQYIGGKDFSGLDYRIAHEKNMKVGRVDMAQMLIKNPPANFLPYNNYCADGMFLEKEFLENKNDFVFIDKTLCYYNYISFLMNDEKIIT